MALAWPLILVILASLVAIVVACTYMLGHFHHPDDANTAWLPKVVVVGGLSLAVLSVMLLPLDVANRNSGSTLDMMLFVYIVYAVLLFVTLVAVPFATFFYEAERAENNRVTTQAYSAICYTIWTIVVFALIAGIMYAFLGKAEIPVKSLTARLQPGDAPVNTACSGCTKSSTFLKFHVSLLVYLVAMLSLIGVLLFICFGGVGMVALPIDLVYDFIERPKRVSLDVLAHRRVAIGVEASRLLAEGEAIAAKTRARGGKRNRKGRKEYAAFQKKVYLLEKKFKREVVAVKANIHPWWYVFYLVVGIGAGIVSFLWMLHIILYMMVDPPASKFLNDMFIDLDVAFPMFGTSAYAVFALFLLWAVVKGNIRVGLRIVWFTIHPLIPHETLMNSLLFNTGLILLASMAVTQFCTTAFAHYARLTAVGSVFGVQIANLQATRYVFQNVSYMFFTVTIVSFLVLVCCYPASQQRKRRRKKNKYGEDDEDD